MKLDRTARQKANGKLCVVILWDDFGGFTVHGDPGVEVFNRHDDPEIEGVYRYQLLPIREDWLSEPATDLGDQLEDHI